MKDVAIYLMLLLTMIPLAVIFIVSLPLLFMGVVGRYLAVKVTKGFNMLEVEFNKLGRKYNG